MRLTQACETPAPDSKPPLGCEVIRMRLIRRTGPDCESASRQRLIQAQRRSPYVVLIVCLLLAASAPGSAQAQDENPDDLLYDRVIRKLVNDRQLKTNALKVGVEDGVVTVAGTVESEKLRLRVGKVVKKIKGVKKVVNQVQVRIRK